MAQIADELSQVSQKKSLIDSIIEYLKEPVDYEPQINRIYTPTGQRANLAQQLFKRAMTQDIEAEPRAIPRWEDMLKTGTGLGLLGYGLTSGAGALKAGLNQIRYNAAVKAMENRLIPQGSMIPKGTEVSLDPSILSAIAEKLMPAAKPGIVSMYAGMPVKLASGGYLEPSKAIPLIQNAPQNTWLLSQLVGFLKDKVSPKEIDLLRGLPLRVTKEQAIQHIEKNIPQVEEVVKGNAGQLNEWEQRRLEELAQQESDFGHMTDADRKEYKELRKRDNADFDKGNATKFSQYQLPGGENYREVLIKAPENEGIQKQEFIIRKTSGEKPWKIFVEGEDTHMASFKTEEEAKHFQYQHDNYYQKEKPDFKSSHWDEPNVLAHARINDHITLDKKKVLHIEEIQSDWARALREGKAQEHPLLKNWQELALKRIVKEAREKGYDYISWTTAEQQFERWGSDAYIWKKEKDGTFRVKYQDQVGGTAGGIDIENEARRRELLTESSNRIVSKEDLKQTFSLSDVMANKIWTKMQEKPTGTSMPRKDFFDLVYNFKNPQLLKDLTKGEVGSINIKIPLKEQSEGFRISQQPDGRYALINNETGTAINFYPDKKSADIALEKRASKFSTLTQPALKITPTPKRR